MRAAWKTEAAWEKPAPVGGDLETTCDDAVTGCPLRASVILEDALSSRLTVTARAPLDLWGSFELLPLETLIVYDLTFEDRLLGGVNSDSPVLPPHGSRLHCTVFAGLQLCTQAPRAVTGPSQRWHSPSPCACFLSDSAPAFEPQTTQEMALYALNPATHKPWIPRYTPDPNS